MRGTGSPVTVFAHGLAGSIEETRPFGSGVHGTRVFFSFRGHGASAGGSAPWTYDALAAELRAVATTYGAHRALGVSLGAGALLRDTVERPGAYDRLVFVLPATLDSRRTDAAVRRMQERAALVARGDVDELADSLVDEQPEMVRARPDVLVWARRQAERLARSEVSAALRELPDQHPLGSRTGLAAVRCPALVVGQEGDAAHPAEVARDLAAALPDARSEIFPPGGVLWTHRTALRALIAGFLNS